LLDFIKLFDQRGLLASGFIQLRCLLFNNAFQLSFLAFLRFLQCRQLVRQRIAGCRLCVACCFPQPYSPTPAASAIAIATALRISAVLFLLFFSINWL
jgi:hypothetical protein